MDVAVAVEEKVVLGDGFFDELLEHGDFRAVDDDVDALLESLHRIECLERVAKQNDGGVTALVHGHHLQRF